jgi:hypothetical protein
MASASQAEGQKFDLAKCMFFCCQEGMLSAHLPRKHISKAMARNGKHFLLVHKWKTTKRRRGRRKQQRAGEAAENDKGQESLSKTTKGRRGRRKRQRAGEAVDNDKGQERLFKTT